MQEKNMGHICPIGRSGVNAIHVLIIASKLVKCIEKKLET